MDGNDPKREWCWIAGGEGEPVGSAFPFERCEEVRFAGQAGYQKVTPWTNDVPHAARRIYGKAGFRFVEGPYHSFGPGLVGRNRQLESSAA